MGQRPRSPQAHAASESLVWALSARMWEEPGRRSSQRLSAHALSASRVWGGATPTLLTGNHPIKRPRGHSLGAGGALESLPRRGRLGHPARSQRALGRVRLSTLFPINRDFNTLAVCAQMRWERQDLAFRGLPGRGSRPVILSNESYRCREARAWAEAAQYPGVQAAARGTKQPEPCCPCEPVGGNAGGLWTSQRLGGPGWLGGGSGERPSAAGQCGHRPGPLAHFTLPFLSSQMAGEAASLSRKGLRSFILK